MPYLRHQFKTLEAAQDAARDWEKKHPGRKAIATSGPMSFSGYMSGTERITWKVEIDWKAPK